MLAVSARGRTEMELEETVDAATGQKAPKKPGKRKRKRLEVDEEKDSDMSGVECSPKRKRKVRCLQVCIIWKIFTLRCADKKMAKQAESVSVLCKRSYIQVR